VNLPRSGDTIELDFKSLPIYLYSVKPGEMLEVPERDGRHFAYVEAEQDSLILRSELFAALMEVNFSTAEADYWFAPQGSTLVEPRIRVGQMSTFQCDVLYHNGYNCIRGSCIFGNKAIVNGKICEPHPREGGKYWVVR